MVWIVWIEIFVWYVWIAQKSFHTIHTIPSIRIGGVRSYFSHIVFSEGKLYLENFEIEESLSTNEEEVFVGRRRRRTSKHFSFSFSFCLCCFESVLVSAQWRRNSSPDCTE